MQAGKHPLVQIGPAARLVPAELAPQRTTHCHRIAPSHASPKDLAPHEIRHQNEGWQGHTKGGHRVLCRFWPVLKSVCGFFWVYPEMLAVPQVDRGGRHQEAADHGGRAASSCGKRQSLCHHLRCFSHNVSSRATVPCHSAKLMCPILCCAILCCARANELLLQNTHTASTCLQCLKPNRAPTCQAGSDERSPR